MSGRLWKYLTPQQEKEFILSLNLLPASCRKRMSGEAQLALLYAISNHVERHYRKVRIPKKDGKSRRLLVPDGLLKGVQRNILRHCLDGRSVSEYACAYRRGLSAADNAAPHAGGGKDKLLLKLDIRDFFDSILFWQVYGAAFPESLFPPAAAGLLTHLCCCGDRLPQGAPTSPAISNLVMKPFDEFMGAWCRQRQIVYTRYCDDLTFSGAFDPKAVYHKARHLLEAMGFALNAEKTALRNRGMRQSVTGLVVNERVRTGAPYRRRIRQEMYYCRKYGVGEHLQAVGRLTGTETQEEAAEAERAFLCALSGKIGYVLLLEPENREFLEYREICRGMQAEQEKASCPPACGEREQKRRGGKEK